MKRIVTGLCLFAAFLCGAEEEVVIPATPKLKSPDAISHEVDQAQRDFEIAQKMFTPWYTGPLITGSANNAPVGKLNFQPYLYLTMNYAQYNSKRKSINTPNSYLVSPLLVLQTGILNWLDVTIVPQAFFRWQDGVYGGNFGDLPLQFGFQLLKENPYIPSLRFVLGELFPTGNYQRLNPNRLGLTATGEGAFQTTFTMVVSKVFWWMKLHPLATRFAANCNVPDHKVTVHGYNSFGGGENTKGEVKVGNSYSADLGLEVSLNQKWVLATDVAYTYSGKSTFTGTAGEASPGVPATNGAPSNDQLSLAPAIEYNINDMSGIIAGVWFSVTGRNSPSFVSLVFSYEALF